MDECMRIEKASQLIQNCSSELIDKVAEALNWKMYSSKYEASAMLREEFEEFWESVKDKNLDDEHTKNELLQIAAVCIKTYNSDIWDNDESLRVDADDKRDVSL